MSDNTYSTFSNGYSGGEIYFYLDAFRTPSVSRITNHNGEQFFTVNSLESKKLDRSITTRLIKNDEEGETYPNEIYLVAPIPESINIGAAMSWETGPSSILESFVSGFQEAASALKSLVGDGIEIAQIIKGMMTGDSSLNIQGMDSLKAHVNEVGINPYDARKKFAGSQIQAPMLTIETFLVDDGTTKDYIINILDNLTDLFLGDIRVITAAGATLTGYEAAPNGFDYTIDARDIFKKKLNGSFTLEIGEFIRIPNLLVENYSIQLQTVNAFDKKPLSARVSVSLTPGKKFIKSDLASWYGGNINYKDVVSESKVGK
jgi:hypothetical protein